MTRHNANLNLGQRITDEDGRLQCHICGKFYRGLCNHVHRAHGITADQYRQEFGLTRHGLVSPDLRKRLSEHAREMDLPRHGEPTRVTKPPPNPRTSPEGRARANTNLIPGGGLEQAQAARRAITHCAKGHPYNDRNTGYDPNGHRYCRECDRIYHRTQRVMYPEKHRAAKKKLYWENPEKARRKAREYRQRKRDDAT